MPWPSAQDRVVGRPGGSGRVSGGDVARLRSIRLHLKAIDNADGGWAALPMAAWCLRTEVTPLLNGPRGDSASRSLIEVAAEFCHDAGLGRL